MFKTNGEGVSLELISLQNGTYKMTPEKGVIENNPTCSLIKSDNENILIDLDHPVKERSDLVQALAHSGLTPQQIKAIVLTHLHPDHIGHKDLFPNACFIFHKEEKLSFHFNSDKTVKLQEDAMYELSADGYPQYVDCVSDLKNLGNSIYIRHCPGHTKGSMVVFVCVDGLVHACAGDIFLNSNYYDRWEPPGMSWNQEMIFDHMKFIKENADVIIPGHGAPFKTGRT